MLSICSKAASATARGSVVTDSGSLGFPALRLRVSSGPQRGQDGKRGFVAARRCCRAHRDGPCRLAICRGGGNPIRPSQQAEGPRTCSQSQPEPEPEQLLVRGRPARVPRTGAFGGADEGRRPAGEQDSFLEELAGQGVGLEGSRSHGGRACFLSRLDSRGACADCGASRR